MNTTGWIKRFSILLLFLYTTSGVPFTKWHKNLDNLPIFIDNEYNYNWFEAWNECASKNMSLITLDSEWKEDMLINLLREMFKSTHNYWLGANDLAEEGKFVWAATGKVFAYSNWSANKHPLRNPDNFANKEHCVHYWNQTDFEWNDNDCRIKMGLICEEHHLTIGINTFLNSLKTFVEKGILVSDRFSSGL
uniref:C-type lectin domain-containing protein n=1 Tax=Glossina brevipalpis TaxID=37001 RepID=A0A1A9W339_9MUSC